MRKHDRSDQDRYLIQRRGIYHYKRRVPAAVADLDERAPHVRVSLKTADLAIARLKRDAIEAADDQLWASLATGDGTDSAMARYKAAVRRVEAFGFTYRTVDEILSRRNLADALSRVEAIADERTPIEAVSAVLGLEDIPPVTVTAAFKVYTDEIVHDELRTKSKAQKASWKKVKQRAVTNFVKLAGDKEMTQVTREDALTLYRFWLPRIAPQAGRPTHSASSGNRDLSNMRVLFDEYFRHIGRPDHLNPFAGLSFSEKRKRSRPPFPTEWIAEHLLKPGLLKNMNAPARGLLLAMVETGARPSELCNILPENIVLDHAVPHLRIMPSEDPDDPFEIKTESSIRNVPLVGVSLAVFKKYPKGFPGFRDRHDNVTTAINKFLRENELRPSDKHSLYSLRHSFEDRMKVGGLDEELRRILMGHAIDRPKYGDGGTLEWRREQLNRIVLPFDPSIV